VTSLPVPRTITSFEGLPAFRLILLLLLVSLAVGLSGLSSVRGGVSNVSLVATGSLPLKTGPQASVSDDPRHPTSATRSAFYN
jgi:hypothetical protein